LGAFGKVVLDGIMVGTRLKLSPMPEG